MAAPPVAAAIGFLGGKTLGAVKRVGAGLVLVGCLASFAMGANDVALASGALVGPNVLSAREAGLLCGFGIALGVLITGRGLLDRVAFDIVAVDRVTATTAQLVQALVILVAVSFGYFTSMNQALVGRDGRRRERPRTQCGQHPEPARDRTRLGHGPTDGVPPGAPCGTCRSGDRGADSLAR